jgi:hypothetical protein
MAQIFPQLGFFGLCPGYPGISLFHQQTHEAVHLTGLANDQLLVRLNQSFDYLFHHVNVGKTGNSINLSQRFILLSAARKIPLATAESSSGSLDINGINMYIFLGDGVRRNRPQGANDSYLDFTSGRGR